MEGTGPRNHHPRGCGVVLEAVSYCPGLQGSSPELLRNNVGLGLTKESLDCQTSDTVSGGSERRRGVKLAPRLCLCFSSRFRLCRLLTLSRLPSFFTKIVYRVFTRIQFPI